MTKFAGIAVAALIAHAGVAFAQPVVIPDEAPPRSRAERPAGGDLRAPGQMEREGPARRQEGAPRAQRGQQGDDSRAQEAPGQPRERSQAQRERSSSPDDPQRVQGQQREQAQRERDQAQRDRDQAQRLREQAQRERPAESPDRRERRSEPGQPAGQTAQPPRTDNQPTASETARPAAPAAGANQAPSSAQRQAPDTNQAPSSSAQRQAPTQPGAQPGTSAGATDAQTLQSRQTAGTQQPDAESQRIADTVRERVERQEIKPVSDLGVSVSVGAELPSRVQLQAVPREIAAIRPQYRDFRYTVSEREIVIVDPRSRRVVEVIARDGGRGHDVYAVFEQRRDVRRWSRPTSVVFERGTVLPASAPYYDLPVELIERNPQWRGYQYVMTESEEVAIVEPRSHRIVEVIGKGGTQQAGTGQTTASLSRQPVAGGGDRHEIVRMILADARPGELNGIDALKGATLPQELRTQPIPAEAVERDQGLKGYHYALVGDDVLVVDPGSRQIIDVIE